MKARVFFHTKWASGMLEGAVAMLLLSAAFSGPAWAITGGEPDNGRHPNVCAVILYHPVFGLIPISGTLINERVVLTAGHAVAGIQAGYATLFGVSFGDEVDLENPSTWLEVSDMACSYGGHGASPNGSDFGLLVLKEPVQGIVPATLPTAGFLDDLKKANQLKAGPNGTKLTVVGYGMLLDWPPPLFFWQDPPVRNTTQAGYLGFNDAWLSLNQNLAAGYGGMALGDSGGPVFWTDPDSGQEVLVSVTSWGAWVAHGFYSRIDTVESLNFIQDVIDSLEE
jgi:hypothetical protein